MLLILNPLSPHDALKHRLTSLITDLIPMKLVYQYTVIFFNFSLTSNHLHPLQVENCDSNSRLVVDEDDYGKLRLERVKKKHIPIYDRPTILYGVNMCLKPVSATAVRTELPCYWDSGDYPTRGYTGP